MSFASDAQRKHFYANNSNQGATNGETRDTFQRMRDDAAQALDNVKGGIYTDFGYGKAYGNERDAQASLDYANEQLKATVMP